jgi:hypothetical protein
MNTSRTQRSEKSVDIVDAYKDVNITNRLPQENLPPKSPPLA